jgi:hypothetical protein
MLGESHNYISQLETAKRECSAAELIAIARQLKRRPGSMLDEVERIVREGGHNGARKESLAHLYLGTLRREIVRSTKSG